MLFVQEDDSVELKEAIDLQELKDKGAEFEVDISNVQPGTVVSHHTAFTNFNMLSTLSAKFCILQILLSSYTRCFLCR